MRGFVIVLFILSFCFTAEAQFTDSQKSNLHSVNEWSNGGGEYGKVNWSETGSGALTADTTTKLRGKASIKFVSSGSGDYVSSAGVSCKEGPNCLVRFWYKTTSANFTAYIYDGSSNLIQTLVLPSNAEFSKAELSFIAATPTTLYSLRVVDGTAGADTVYIDQGSLGANDNIGTVTQAEYVGSIEFSSDCRFNTTSLTFADTSDATCTKTVDGNVATNGNVLGLRILQSRKGAYQLILNSRVSGNNFSEANQIRVFDGTTSWGTQTIQAPTAATDFGVTGATFAYNYTSQPPTTFNISLQTKSGGSDFDIWGGAAAPSRSFAISVFFFPSQSEQVTRAENANQFGSVKWPETSGCTFTSTSGVLTDSDCNAGVVTPSGSITSGTDQTSFTATNLRANEVYEISANGILDTFSSSTNTVCNYYLDDGATVIAISRVSSEALGINDSYSPGLFGYISYSSFQASKTFSLKATRLSGDGTCNAQVGQSNNVFTMSIKPVYPTQAMTQIINSVGTTAPNQTIFNSVVIGGASLNTACTGICATYQETGDWMGVPTRNSAGNITAPINAGIFSSAPNCGCGGRNVLNQITCVPDASSSTNTSQTFRMFKNGDQSAVDESIIVWCQGNK